MEYWLIKSLFINSVLWKKTAPSLSLKKKTQTKFKKKKRLVMCNAQGKALWESILQVACLPNFLKTHSGEIWVFLMIRGKYKENEAFHLHV